MNTAGAHLYAQFREAEKWFLPLENVEMVTFFGSIRILRLMISVVAVFLILSLLSLFLKQRIRCPF